MLARHRGDGDVARRRCARARDLRLALPGARHRCTCSSGSSARIRGRVDGDRRQARSPRARRRRRGRCSWRGLAWAWWPARRPTARSSPTSAAPSLDAVPLARPRAPPAAPRSTDGTAAPPAARCRSWPTGSRRRPTARTTAAARHGARTAAAAAHEPRASGAERPGGRRRAAGLGLPVRPAAAPRRGRQPGAGGQHQGRHRRLRRRLRPRVGDDGDRAQHQRGVRVRQLHRLRRRRGRLPGGAGRRPGRRRRAGEHRRRGQLRLRRVPDLRAAEQLVVTLDGPLSDAGMARSRRSGRDPRSGRTSRTCRSARSRASSPATRPRS